jgi:hypothetical protein
MSITDALDAGRTRVPLRFTVPEQLREIFFDEPAETRIERTYRELRTSLRGLTSEQALHLVYTQEQMLAKLWDEGAVYVGQCCARSDAEPTTLTTAQFTILVKKAELQAERPLAAVAGGLKKPGEPRELIFVDYPAGEALVVGEELTVRTPFTPLGRPTPTTHRLRQAQVILPFPDKRRLAIIGVSSEDLEDWRSYVEILDGIARSVSFTEPGVNPISEHMLGAG